MTLKPIILVTIASTALSGCFLSGNSNTANTLNPGAGLTATFAPTSAASFATMAAANGAGAGLTGFAALEDNTVQRARIETAAPFTVATVTLGDGTSITVNAPAQGGGVNGATQSFFQSGVAGVDLTQVEFGQGINLVSSIGGFFLNDVRGYTAWGVETPEAALPTGTSNVYSSGIAILHLRDARGSDAGSPFSINANLVANTYTAETFSSRTPGAPVATFTASGSGDIVGTQLVGTLTVSGTVGTGSATAPIAGTANMNGGFFGPTGGVVTGVVAGTNTAIGGAGGNFTGYFNAELSLK